MSRIGDLIVDLCPHGVPFHPMGEVGTFVRGNGLQKSDLVAAGTGAIHYGEVHTHYGAWATETKSFVDRAHAARLRRALPGDIVIATTSEDDDAVAKAVAWIGTGEVAVSGDAFIYRHSLEPKFVAYFFQAGEFQDQKKRHITGAKVRRISGESLAKIRIPVPPLEVQREIVKILDAFTELEARQRQYEYYRHSLLTFADADAGWLTLADVCTSVFSGGTPLSTRTSYYGGDIPWLRTQEVQFTDIHDTAVKITSDGLDNSSARWVRADSVIVAISGAGVTRGRAAVNKIPLTTNQHCCNLEIDESRANHRFVFY